MPILELDQFNGVCCHQAYWPEQFNPVEERLAWPGPRFLFGALHTALHRQFPQIQLWEHNHAFGVCGRYPERHIRWQRFGSLASAGPFPRVIAPGGSQWLFAGPHDAVWESGQGIGASLARVERGEQSSLPEPLCLVTNPGAKGRFEKRPLWWSKPAIEAYLQGNPVDAGRCFPPADLYQIELSRPNRFANPPAQNASGLNSPCVRLYLKEDVAMSGWASMPLKEERYRQGLDQLFVGQDARITFGALEHRARVCALEPELLERWLPLSAPNVSTRVKWLLLSPAIFPARASRSESVISPHPGGWLPNWICPKTGQVFLRKGEQIRGSLSREDWRKQVCSLPALDCRLVACSVAGAVTVAGSREDKSMLPDGRIAQAGPRSARLAVPAGTVYFFEGPDAPALAEALAWHGTFRQEATRIYHRRSTLYGEQGFGLGVCGTWDYPNREHPQVKLKRLLH